MPAHRRARHRRAVRPARRRRISFKKIQPVFALIQLCVTLFNLARGC